MEEMRHGGGPTADRMASAPRRARRVAPSVGVHGLAPLRLWRSTSARGGLRDLEAEQLASAPPPHSVERASRRLRRSARASLGAQLARVCARRVHGRRRGASRASSTRHPGTYATAASRFDPESAEHGSRRPRWSSNETARWSPSQCTPLFARRPQLQVARRSTETLVCVRCSRFITDGRARARRAARRRRSRIFGGEGERLCARSGLDGVRAAPSRRRGRLLGRAAWRRGWRPPDPKPPRTPTLAPAHDGADVEEAADARAAAPASAWLRVASSSGRSRGARGRPQGRVEAARARRARSNTAVERARREAEEAR